MGCGHYYALAEGKESAFSVDITSIVFGPGVLAELGEHAKALGMTRVALFTDKRISLLPFFSSARDSLRHAGLTVAVFDEVRIEPTDKSFLEAARFAANGSFDGYVSVGGGSVIDSCKAANLYATYPADLLTYVNAPIGAGKPVPGALKPHIACPTTCGTGSECTGIAIFDLLSMQVKTGIASRRLRPSLALIDPATTYTLPKEVVAASGFDVLSHALESYTPRSLPPRPWSAPRVAVPRRAQTDASSAEPSLQGARCMAVAPLESNVVVPETHPMQNCRSAGG
jgi:hydroxyacid-oxoacid transhydrogenase